MTVGEAVEVYITDMRAQERINSEHTERAYRSKLNAHAADTGDRDLSEVGKRQVNRTLKRWKAETSRRQGQAVLASFYNWAEAKGLVRATPVPASSWATPETSRVRELTQVDARALLDFSLNDLRDERVVHLALCAGLRVSEIPSIDRRNFLREDGWLWVPARVGKHGERYIPVTEDLEPVAERMDLEPLGLGYAGLHKRMQKLGRVAQVEGVTPQAMRSTFARQMRAYVGRNATASMLGQAQAPPRVDDETAAKVYEFTYWS